MKKLLAISLIGVILLLAGCGGGAGGGLSGTYVDESGTMSFTFSGNKVAMDFDGYEINGKFEAKGGILKIFDVEDEEDAALITGETEYTLAGNVLTIDGVEFTKK